MKFISGAAIAYVAIAASLVGAIPTARVGAVYTMTNDQSGNHILIHSVAQDGTVSYIGSKYAKGTGAHGLGEDPVLADALLGQGSLQVVGNHLYHVNAGSGTVVMWEIDPVDPTIIKMVGNPESSGGDFPTSIAISAATGNLCVLNGGTKNGVSCMTVSTKTGLTTIGNSFRSGGLTQTNPATGIPNTNSALTFNADMSKLVASIKGPDITTPGHLLTWDVSAAGTLSEGTVVTEVANGRFPLGMAAIPGSDALLGSDFSLDPAQASLGAAIYDFSKTPVESHAVQIPGAMTTCWSLYAKKSNSFFMTDFAAASVHEVSVDKALKGQFVASYALPMYSNPTDIAVGTIGHDEFLYALAPNLTSVDVLQIEKHGKSKVIQTYDFKPLVNSKITINPVNVQGMGVYIIQK